MTAPSRRHVVRRYARLKVQAIFLAVHRVEFTVFYRRLQQGEYELLRGIGSGATMGAALDFIQGLQPDQVQGWFAHWAQLGWLCRGPHSSF